jgi:hypothetical protein
MHVEMLRMSNISLLYNSCYTKHAQHPCKPERTAIPYTFTVFNFCGAAGAEGAVNLRKLIISVEQLST